MGVGGYSEKILMRLARPISVGAGCDLAKQDFISVFSNCLRSVDVPIIIILLEGEYFTKSSPNKITKFSLLSHDLNIYKGKN